MIKKLLILTFFSVVLTTIGGCSPSEEIYVTMHGQRNALIMGKWSLESTVYLDHCNNVVYQHLPHLSHCPPQTLEFHKQDIVIQTDYYEVKDEHGNYYNERYPKQWLLREDTLYLGIGRNLEGDFDQVKEVKRLDEQMLILDTLVCEENPYHHLFNVQLIRDSYVRVY